MIHAHTHIYKYIHTYFSWGQIIVQHCITNSWVTCNCCKSNNRNLKSQPRCAITTKTSYISTERAQSALHNHIYLECYVSMIFLLCTIILPFMQYCTCNVSLQLLLFFLRNFYYYVNYIVLFLVTRPFLWCSMYIVKFILCKFIKQFPMLGKHKFIKV